MRWYQQAILYRRYTFHAHIHVLKYRRYSPSTQNTHLHVFIVALCIHLSFWLKTVLWTPLCDWCRCTYDVFVLRLILSLLLLIFRSNGRLMWPQICINAYQEADRVNTCSFNVYTAVFHVRHDSIHLNVVIFAAVRTGTLLDESGHENLERFHLCQEIAYSWCEGANCLSKYPIPAWPGHACSSKRIRGPSTVLFRIWHCRLCRAYALQRVTAVA